MTDQQKKEMLKMLLEQKAELLRQADAIAKTIDILENKISINKLKVDNPESKEDSNAGYNQVKTKANIYPEDYDPNMAIWRKITYLLKREQRFLHNREMAQMIAKIEPEINIGELVKRFSSVLSSMKAKKQIVNIVVNNNNRNTFWGVKKWLDEDGNPKPEHMYNEEYITVTKEGKIIDI